MIEGLIEDQTSRVCAMLFSYNSTSEGYTEESFKKHNHFSWILLLPYCIMIFTKDFQFFHGNMNQRLFVASYAVADKKKLNARNVDNDIRLWNSIYSLDFASSGTLNSWRRNFDCFVFDFTVSSRYSSVHINESKVLH